MSLTTDKAHILASTHDTFIDRYANLLYTFSMNFLFAAEKVHLADENETAHFKWTGRMSFVWKSFINKLFIMKSRDLRCDWCWMDSFSWYDQIETSYSTQLKICYLMTTFRRPSDILITSWLFTDRLSTWPGNTWIGTQDPTNSAAHGTRWFPGHVLHQAVNNQDVIKMSDGHRNVVSR